MKKNGLLVLSIATLAALGVAALALRDDSSVASTAERASVFPELSAHVNDVAKVRVEKEGKAVTLQREGGKWNLVDRGGYPALFEKVKELVVRMAELQIEEEKTNRRENHSKLELEWPSQATDDHVTSTARVTLEDANGKELAALVVGKSEWRGGKAKVYVRRAAEDQVYLCSLRSSLDLESEAKSWIDTKLVSIPGDRVQSVTIEHADGESVEIGRSAANHTQFTLQNMPIGRTESYAGVANGVAQALSSMPIEDVRPASEIDFTKEPVARTRFHCTDGLDLLIETARVDDRVWARLEASYTPPTVATPAADEIQGDPPSATTSEPPTEDSATGTEKDVAKEAEEMNQRFTPWAFELGSYKVDQLAKRMKDLLAEPTPTAVGDGGLDLGPDQDESDVDGSVVHEDAPPMEDEEPTPATPDDKADPK